jgi:hypothetical protein
MCHITTWEEDYNGNNISASLQSPLANSSSPSCRTAYGGDLSRLAEVSLENWYVKVNEIIYGT